MKTSPSKLSVLTQSCLLAFVLTGCATDQEKQVTKTRQKVEEAKKLERIASRPMQELAIASDSRSMMAPQILPAPIPERFHIEQDRENYQDYDENSVKSTLLSPLSTFSIDVDTGAYTNSRRMLNEGRLPPEAAVRAEEFINYFDYDYAVNNDDDEPFTVFTELAESPYAAQHQLLRVALRADDVDLSERPSANLVFLLDVSGSMNAPDKLPLLKRSLILLARQMTADDKISIVVYAGASGVALEPTSGNEQRVIESALEKLRAGGSTHGSAGIHLAYQMAESAFIEGGINRVLLATDGDFNVGTTDHDALMKLIEQKRKSGIELTTLGFGTGNYNDHLMEQLADKGNGQYRYIDSILEARKVLVDELSGSLVTLASDVKIQIEFNPAVVGEYRLIGYENRALKDEDFKNDKIDAGEIGAGHRVTALYELHMRDAEGGRLEPLKYQANSTPDNHQNELATVKLRYKKPGVSVSQERVQIIRNNKAHSIEDASQDMQFAAAVAGFAQQLKGGKYLADYGYQDTLALARRSIGSDPQGIRAEFIQLVRIAESLSETEKVSQR